MLHTARGTSSAGTDLDRDQMWAGEVISSEVTISVELTRQGLALGTRDSCFHPPIIAIDVMNALPCATVRHNRHLLFPLLALWAALADIAYGYSTPGGYERVLFCYAYLADWL